MHPAQEFSAASQSSIAAQRAVLAVIRSGHRAGLQFRGSSLAGRVRSIRRARRWGQAVLADPVDRERVPVLAHGLGLADHRVPASVRGPAQAVLRLRVRHLVHNGLLRVDAADVRSILRQKKAQ